VRLHFLQRLNREDRLCVHSALPGTAAAWRHDSPKALSGLVEVELPINVEVLEMKAGLPRRVRAPVQKCFRAPQQRRTGKGKSRVTMQRASNATWPLAAIAVNTTNHYLITSDTTEKDKNICTIVGPLAPFRTVGPQSFLPATPHPLHRYRIMGEVRCLTMLPVAKFMWGRG
jgi:hypothetical protein